VGRLHSRMLGREALLELPSAAQATSLDACGIATEAIRSSN
jgi:hypothetical protein